MINPEIVCHEVFYTTQGSLGDCFDENLDMAKITKDRNELRGLLIGQKDQKTKIYVRGIKGINKDIPYEIFPAIAYSFKIISKNSSLDN